MNRRDEYLESMLTDLGSAYYQTLQADAAAAGAARAGETQGPRDGVGAESAVAAEAGVGTEARRPHRGRWRVRDVMTTDVVSIAKSMGYQQVARLLVLRGLSAVPVVSGGGRLLGMVSEADVLRKNERSFARVAAGLPRRTHHEREQADALTAAELMNSPAITIHPDAPLGAAARLMNGHHIRLLPVVDPAGELIGIVSRRDLLGVFLRPDAEVAAEVVEALGELAGPGAATGTGTVTGTVTVAVTEGEVTLAGSLRSAESIADAVRAAGEVDGGVTVFSELAVG